MEIRKARLKDVAQIADYGFELLKYHQRIDSYFAPDKNSKNFYQKLFRKFIHSKNSNLLVAENCGEIIGYALGGIHPRMSIFKIKRIGSINDMFVREDFREAGISKLFLIEMKKWFKSKKIKYVELSVHVENKIGKKVWLRYGFKDYMIKQRIEIDKLHLK